MFPVDSLPPQYCEERAAAEAAKRLAQEQKQQAAQQPNTKLPTPQTQPVPSSSLSQALRPQLSRPGSSSVLGNIFQGFVRAAASQSGTSTPTEGSSTRAPTPVTMSKEEKARLEALAKARESQRDTDICALPGWH